LEVSRIENFTKGWVIGNYVPSLIQTKDIEIGIKEYSEGEEEEAHIHKVSTEITIVLSGEIEMNGSPHYKGDIITIEKEEEGKFKALSDNVVLVCIKTPSDPLDKYIVK
jgi:quercetin dioxygenase-like cupin family protein